MRKKRWYFEIQKGKFYFMNLEKYIFRHESIFYLIKLFYYIAAVKAKN